MLKHRFHPLSVGFTLIELMITMALLALVLMIALPNYTIWIQNTHIRGAAQSILNGLQRARAEAISRNAQVSFVLGGANFWTVSEVSTGLVLDSKPQAEIPATLVVAVTPVGGTTVTYTGLGTVAAAGFAQVDVDSNAIQAADSRELRVVVTAGGTARMCDPNPGVVAPDPRAC